MTRLFHLEEKHVLPPVVPFYAEQWLLRGLEKSAAVVTKMAKKDESILQPMKDLGIDTYLIPSEETSYNRVLHESENVDERTMTLLKSAGLISINDVPELDSTCVHLAGISDTEFDMALMKGLKSRNYKSLSVDMQSFVRHINPVTKNHEFSDVADKKEIACHDG